MAELAEYVDGLPNICGQEALIEQAIANAAAPEQRIDLRHARSTFAIAVNKPEMFPLPVALALLRSAYSSESYGPIMAGAALSAVPLLIVFLIGARNFIADLAKGAARG